MTRALVLLGVVCFGIGRVTAQEPAATAPGAPRRLVKRCVVNQAAPNVAETAYNHKDYVVGEKLFREMLAKDPHDPAAHEGLIRDLIEQNKVSEAARDADGWVKAEPGSSMAAVAAGEVRLRQGDPREALLTFGRANAMDLCNDRALYGIFEVDELRGAYASAKKIIEQAYLLHPSDNEIQMSWVWTRKHNERLAKLREYAEHTDQISEEDRVKLKTRLEKESLYRSTDCRMGPGSPQAATIAMQAVTDGPYRFLGWGLDVQFNGKRRRLQIDTGASGITISRAAARSLGIQREDAVETRGIGDKGKVKTSVAHIASVRIGGLEFTNCPVEILEKWSVLDADGLIGTDVFDRSLVALDFPKHELRVEPLPLRPGETTTPEALASLGSPEEESEPHDPYVAPEMAQWQRIYRRGHELLIPAAVADTRGSKDVNAWRDKLFLLDTGAATNLISPAAAAEVTKVSHDSDYSIRGISGEVNHVYEAGKFSLMFGSLKLDSPSMTSIDLTDISHHDGVEVSGLIGAPSLFQLVLHIDYRDNLVWCEYHPPSR